MQWAVNAYLLSLAALFAFGGRLADTRRAPADGRSSASSSSPAASALCGLTPKGGLAEAWIVTFRVIQGAGGAIMFPAALAIVVQTFPLRDRGKALALFFGIAGGLTAVGPILGGYLTEWTWRAIFWVNIPVAAHRAGPDRRCRSRSPSTGRRGWTTAGWCSSPAGVGAAACSGSSSRAIWGWSNPGTALCIAAGVVLLVVFYRVELRTASPLIQVHIFRIRPFLVENLVLGIAMLVFIPVFFFASEYAQISLGKSASNASLYLLYFFLGFVVAAQIGGRMLDRGGAKRPVVLGCALGAVGFYFWAGKVTGLSLNAQIWTSSWPAPGSA